MSNEPQAPDLPEQMRVRRDKRARLLASGREPYPVAVDRTHTLAQVRAAPPGPAAGHRDRRRRRRRRPGDLRPQHRQAVLRDPPEGDGTELQVMFSLAEVGAEALADWKADVDLGDHVFVHGGVITSRRGELSVLADLAMAAKALRPLPNVHKPSSPRRPGSGSATPT